MTTLYHRIPFKHLQNLFSTEYWAKVHKTGSEALKAPKVASWYFSDHHYRENQGPCSASLNAKLLANEVSLITSGFQSSNSTTEGAGSRCGAADIAGGLEVLSLPALKRKRQPSRDYDQDETLSEVIPRFLPMDSSNVTRRTSLRSPFPRSAFVLRRPVQCRFLRKSRRRRSTGTRSNKVAQAVRGACGQLT